MKKPVPYYLNVQVSRDSLVLTGLTIDGVAGRPVLVQVEIHAGPDLRPSTGYGFGHIDARALARVMFSTWRRARRPTRPRAAVIERAA